MGEVKMYAQAGQNAREIVNFVNMKNIQKDDIVSLTFANGQFILFYYDFDR